MTIDELRAAILKASPTCDCFTFRYVNHRGKEANRRVRPSNYTLALKTSEYHDGPQWILTAFDLDKEAYRDFTVATMSDFRAEFIVPFKGK